MDICFTAHEARVIGCLLEKQVTTPEQYPLSLNTLTNACNQKSSRDPVMVLDETTIQNTIDALVKDHYVTEKRISGNRVPKYQHRFCNTEFGDLKFTNQEFGIVCVLLLRGAQTPGELRTRTDRLCKFQDINEVESTLDQLMRRDDGPFVAKLPRVPGKREIRYAHLFSDEGASTEASESVNTESIDNSVDTDRIDQLEQMIVQLRNEVSTLKERLNRIDPNQDEA